MWALLICMPTLNEETGFYRGKIYEHDGQNYRGECVPVAVANYLRLKEIPKDTIENVVNSIIRVTLYGNFTEDSMPDEYSNHVKQLPDETDITTPFIALTQFEGLQHLWVMTDKLERIDYDGQVHKELDPIGGYLEIKGL